MELLIGIAVVLVLVAVGFALIGAVFKLLFYLVIGLVIGTVAKAVLPGRQDLGWAGTALAGIAGSLVGGMLSHRVLHVHGLMSFVVSVLCAAGVIVVLSGQKRLP